MYLLINNTQYPVTKRIITGDTVKYLSVSQDPRPVSGPVQMYRDDGFLLAEDDSEGYTRQTYRCKEATAYSPEEYPQAWEAV